MDPRFSQLMDTFNFLQTLQMSVPIMINSRMQGYLLPLMAAILGFMFVVWLLKRALGDEQHFFRELFSTFLGVAIVLVFALFSTVIVMKVVPMVHNWTPDLFSLVSDGKARNPIEAGLQFIAQGYDLSLQFKGKSKFWSTDGWVWVFTSWVAFAITCILGVGIIVFGWISLWNIDIVLSFVTLFVCMRLVPPFQSLLSSSILQIFTYMLEYLCAGASANMFFPVLRALADGASRDIENGVYALTGIVIVGIIAIFSVWASWGIARGITGRWHGYSGGLLAVVHGYGRGARSLASNPVTRAAGRQTRNLSKAIGGAVGRELEKVIRRVLPGDRSRQGTQVSGGGARSSARHTGDRYPEVNDGSDT